MQHLLCVPTGSRSDQNEDPNRAVEEWWKTAASITTSLGFWDCVSACTCVYVGWCCKCTCDCVKPQDILLFFQFIFLSPAQFTLFKLLNPPQHSPLHSHWSSQTWLKTHTNILKFCAHSFCIFLFILWTFKDKAEPSLHSCRSLSLSVISAVSHLLFLAAHFITPVQSWPKFHCYASSHW